MSKPPKTAHDLRCLRHQHGGRGHLLASQLRPPPWTLVARRKVRHCATSAIAGFPAAVVRAGTSSQGLPIGVQIVGRPWEEHVVLAVAQFLETALGGWQPVPPPVLKIQGAPPSFNLSWKGYGTLEKADAIEPWTELPQAQAPYRITKASPSLFYRVRQ